MKYEDALEMGKECGLESPAEAINNVFAHSTMLFEWSKIQDEETELIADAKKHGIVFCPNCDMALLNGVCYMERNFSNIK